MADAPLSALARSFGGRRGLVAAAAAGLAAAVGRGTEAGARRRCPTCPKGTRRLANGTCAASCAAASCTNAVGSGNATEAGTNACYCVGIVDCSFLTAACADTAGCPKGSVCIETLCGPGGGQANRCIGAMTAAIPAD